MDAARSAACLAQTASCKRTGKSGSASSANDRNHREERSATQWAGRGQAVDNPGMIPGPESCPQAVPERASSYQRDVNAIKFNKFNKLIVRSEEHTSELQSLMRISYAVFCLKQKNQHNQNKQNT